MVKKDIIDNISDDLGIDKDDIRIIVDSFMQQVSKGIASGENIYLRGFGTFKFKTMKEKKGRDMVRGKTVIIPEHKKLFFNAGSAIVESIKKLNESNKLD